MQFQITHCVKCGAELQRGGRGRPSRFCSDGCKSSAEAEMRRINVNLRKLEERRANEVYGSPDHRARLDGSISELQRRFDHLSGVPNRQDDEPETPRGTLK